MEYYISEEYDVYRIMRDAFGISGMHRNEIYMIIEFNYLTDNGRPRIFVNPKGHSCNLGAASGHPRDHLATSGRP